MKRFLIGLMATIVSISAFAGFLDERTKSAPEVSSASAPAGETAPVEVQPAAPKVDTSLAIRHGDLFSERLPEWAKRNGYTLIWEAPEYRSGGELVLTEDFDRSLDLFLGSMRMNKVRLEAEIYANNVVRIFEVK